MAQDDFIRKKYPHPLARNGDDWLIYYKSKRSIGRVTLDERTTRPRWTWVVWTSPGDKGTTDTLEAALQAVKGSILSLPPEKRVKPMTPGDRLRRDNPDSRHYR